MHSWLKPTGLGCSDRYAFSIRWVLLSVYVHPCSALGSRIYLRNYPFVVLFLFLFHIRPNFYACTYPDLCLPAHSEDKDVQSLRSRCLSTLDLTRVVDAKILAAGTPRSGSGRQHQ